VNRENIIAMVQEAVIEFPNANPFDFRLLQIETIERFAALVAAAEREACCKIVHGQCESDNVAQRTVDAIRARGEVPR
jgi:hypothetical protein